MDKDKIPAMSQETVNNICLANDACIKETNRVRQFVTSTAVALKDAETEPNQAAMHAIILEAIELSLRNQVVIMGTLNILAIKAIPKPAGFVDNPPYQAEG